MYGCTTSSLLGSRIRWPCTDAGMPDVLDQKSADGFARDSIWGQRSCLKAMFSGPCSCMMSASVTAPAREGAIMRRPVARRCESVSPSSTSPGCAASG